MRTIWRFALSGRRRVRQSIKRFEGRGQIRHLFGFHSKVSAIRKKEGCDICRRYWRGSWDV